MRPLLLLLLHLSTATNNNSNNTHEFAVAGILPLAALLAHTALFVFVVAAAAVVSAFRFVFLLHKNTTLTQTRWHTRTHQTGVAKKSQNR